MVFPGIGVKARQGSPAPGGSILITSAPKSAKIVAAAGPAIQLAQSMTCRPAKRLSGMVVFPHETPDAPDIHYAPRANTRRRGDCSHRPEADIVVLSLSASSAQPQLCPRTSTPRPPPCTFMMRCLGV